MKRGYQSEIRKADYQSVLDTCDALYFEGLIYDEVAAVMQDYGYDPDDCELSDVMLAVRKILGSILGEHLEYDAYVPVQTGQTQ